MSSNNRLTRRSFLRGAMGAMVALPWLELFASKRAVASVVSSPLRAVFVYVPNGIFMPGWTPLADETFPYILEPLAPLRDQILVLSGLSHRHGYSNGDGPGGDHARSSSVFLTGTHVKRTEGEDYEVGISVDQLMALQMSGRTSLRSLEIGCDEGPKQGQCDPGYHCVYSKTISWSSEFQPVSKLVNPRIVFERLFNLASDSSFAQRGRYMSSVLDFIQEDARQLQKRLGARDSRRLDEYLTSVRGIEKRIERSESSPNVKIHRETPKGIPANYGEHVSQMYELMALALQTDQTRVATFYVDTEASNRSYDALGIREGHHDLSHHGGDPQKIEKIQRINRFHVEQFSSFLDKLASSAEEGGSVLDHSMILYGSGLSNADQHYHNNLPIVLAGKGGGTIKTGRHLKYPSDVTPLSNLHVALLERMGTPVKSFGDSTESLRFLDS